MGLILIHLVNRFSGDMSFSHPEKFSGKNTDAETSFPDEEKIRLLRRVKLKFNFSSKNEKQ
jgi:hypothetical protein